STQVVLSGRQQAASESDLIAQIGTNVNGTDDISWVLRALQPRLPDGQYAVRYMPNDPPTQAQRDQLWADVSNSLNAGYGVVANIVAPPSNYPRGVKGSVSPNYSGGTVYHYVAIMGIDPDARALWIADPGFSPFGYWISFDQMATLIPPKGYAYATATPAEAQPAPQPTGSGDEFKAWVASATDRKLLEYITNQLGPGDPA
ncbi:C39 family peptidase, partial [Mycobacterium sp. 1245801.1]|uniref:C39 family peptidase n=1 Tax=Mycobacterium sp. 1245801.1 TaxID=1834075 RepID=UPI000AB0575D